ncbi:butyrate kinase 1 [Peptoclostridium acidaminophilum DSM 3953]|uniref:Probable butyrate kinase n=1 Tax=Peptoclostridium acidaminophilum DSM 3953 TaxID=1286171 RepID=W8U538_PEPAC|nr:butyrate kinase [Peptoclostridium acidaminophilum]AHM56071.1 butyrate kinase 1 [Peptoclostridium acidaminophilum DSM 3953]
MGLDYKILTINPGSTSTKIAVFENESMLFDETLRHPEELLQKYEGILGQDKFRREAILNFLKEKGVDVSELDAVVGRGGMIKPLEGGTYTINEKMIKDLQCEAVHASNIAGLIAYDMSKEVGIPSFVVDPPVVDEMEDIAKISGFPGIERSSRFHALNQKAVARRIAMELGKLYEECNFVVAHVGGGITVGAHRSGRVIDVNNGLDGEGPFSPNRSGGFPVGDLVELCFSGDYTKEQIKGMIVGNSGLVGYLGVNDAREVEKMIDCGDEKAKLIYDAMAYQVAKEIGACAVVLSGNVDAIILTGGIAYSEKFTKAVRDRVEFIGQFIVYPGEDELRALAEGGLGVLRGETAPREY